VPAPGDTTQHLAASGGRLAHRYRLGARIGRGGMADVFEAYDESLRRPVAIKRLRAEHTEDPDLHRRFAREARAGAQIHHPNVVAIYDVGDDAGAPFFVMERLPGRTLHDETAGGALPMPRVRELAIEILGALGAAHRLGILHRDVKPANVLLDEHGHAKLGDFGIAHVSDDIHHTTTGLVLGTLSYLAPERLAGAPATPAADLYATGILLFEAATGRTAFRADSPLALTRAVAHDLPTFTPDDRRRLEPRFVAAVERAIAKEPADRFESVDGMVAAIGTDRAASAATPTAPVRTTVPPTGRLPNRPTTAPASGAPRHSWRRLRTALFAVAALAAAVGALAIAGSSGSPTPTPPSASTSTSTPTPSVPGAFGRALDGIDRSIGR
jgi:serine/threonine-protein kinase